MNDRTLRRRGFASPLFVDPWSMIRKSEVPVFRKIMLVKRLERGRDSVQSERAFSLKHEIYRLCRKAFLLMQFCTPIAGY
jgi:hypothetical protein